MYMYILQYGEVCYIFATTDTVELWTGFRNTLPNHTIGLATVWHIRPLKQTERYVESTADTVFTRFGKSNYKWLTYGCLCTFERK